MKRFMKWLGRSLRAPQHRPAPARCRPAIESLESRLLPTVSITIDTANHVGYRSVVEDIRTDWTPTTLTVWERNNTIFVTANTDIVLHYYSNPPMTYSPGDGPVALGRSWSGIQAVEIHSWGDDVYNLLATGAPVTVFAGWNDAINIGEAGDGMQSINGFINVEGGVGNATLTLNDQADGAAHTVSLYAARSVPMGAPTDGGIVGLAPVSITYASSEVSTLNVQLGSAADTVNVGATTIATNVVCGGNATVNVGTGSLQGIDGAVNVLPGAGRPTLNVCDQNDSAGHPITLSTGGGDGTVASITGLASAPITFDNAHTAAVNLDLYGQAVNTLNVDGSADATGRTVNVSAWNPTLVHLGGNDLGTITGLMPAAVQFTPEGVSSLTVQTGLGAEDVEVTNQALPGTRTQFIGHSARTDVNVTEPTDLVLAGGQGPLTIASTVAGGTHLTVRGPAPAPSGSPAFETVSDPVTGESIAFAPAAVGDLTLFPQGGITIAATDVPTTVYCSRNGGITIGSGGTTAGILAPVTLTSNVFGTSVGLTIDDSADRASHAATLGGGNYAWFDADHTRHIAYGITGLAPAPISYDTPTVGSLWLGTGTGAETVNVQALAVPSSWVVAHSDNTTINLGNAGSVAAVRTSLYVQGDLTPAGTPAHPHVVLDDSADASPRTLAVVPVGLPNVAPYGSSWIGLPPNFPISYERIAGLPGLSVLARAWADMPSVLVKTGVGGATVTGGAVAPTTVAGNPLASNTVAESSATWTLTGADAGNIGLLSWTGFGNLQAGAAANTFAFGNGASVSGALTGGGTSSTLDYTADANYDVVVNLQTGQATGVGHLAGSFGTVIGATGGGAYGAYNLLVGNGGATLVGGHGRRNLLIAGPQAARLVAGDQGDILIAGSTAYDRQAGLTALEAVMTQWARTDLTYLAREQAVMQGSPGNPALNAADVFSNGGPNTVQDPFGLDLLFVRPGVDSYTAYAWEAVVDL